MKRANHLLLVTLVVLCAAPTAGDIGSCGQEPEDLDAFKFFSRKGGIDLARCDECGFDTGICRARRRGELEAKEFPEHCFPLVHDGEVCLNALEDADCDEYAAYVRDEGPTVPTECNFCPLGGSGGGGGGS